MAKEQFHCYGRKINVTDVTDLKSGIHPTIKTRLPYRLLRTTRGNSRRNINSFLFGLHFPQSFIPGTDAHHAHTCTSLLSHFFGIGLFFDIAVTPPAPEPRLPLRLRVCMLSVDCVCCCLTLPVPDYEIKLHMDPNSSDDLLQKTSPNNDPAAVARLSSELSAQATQLVLHHHQLARLTTLTEELVKTLQGLQLMPSTAAPVPSTPPPTLATSPVVSSPAAISPRLAFPEKFNGDPTKCKGFPLQCSLFVNQQPALYPTDSSSIAFVCALLTGRALDWATAIWRADAPTYTTFEELLRHFREVFEHPAGGRSAGEELLNLLQGRRTAADYALSFRTLAAQTTWVEDTLKLLFRRGLNQELQSELACRDEDRSLSSYIELAIQVDNLIRTRRSPRTITHPQAEAPLLPEPMQIGTTHLTSEERETCAQSSLPLLRSSWSCQVHLPHSSSTCAVEALDGRPLGEGKVQNITEVIQMHVGALHKESIQFYTIQSAHHSLILGLSWLRKHDPRIAWREGKLLQWSAFCQNNCISPIQPSSNDPPSLPDANLDTAKLPTEYQDLQLAFSKEKATQLPPHRSVDCAIELLPGQSPPKGRIFPLSQPESEAMSNYIKEELAKGFIHPSTSPASAGFFFVKKKDGGLRPCIDYRGLNEVTVKFRYPLPLVPAALEQLRQAKYYTKLDLRNAYNLIHIREGDEWKTAFSTTSGHYEYRVMPYGMSNSPSVFQAFMNDIFRDMLDRWVIVYIDDILIYSHSMPEHIQHVRAVLKRLIHQEGVAMDERKVEAVLRWPQPQTLKELQCFLGFANFYRRFIRNFSSVAAPLTAMTKRQRSRLNWSPEAQRAFNELRERFTSAPILRHPDPKQPFIVEVDASNTGVGAVLSQRHGTKNTKVDALSRQTETTTQPEHQETILPSTLLLAPVQWDIITEIENANQQAPPPPECPPGKLFVPEALRERVLTQVHSVPSSGHPGIDATIHLLRNRFWWPTLATETIHFVNNCSTCESSKPSTHLPAGLLQPLPLPQRPWSHIAIDFITDLPNSQGNTVIFTIVDRFSKACRLIPISKLPSAFEAAELLCNQVFRFYGLPEDIVSDRRPQFTSRLWSSFFKLFNVNISLTSGYHPQSNGQTERLNQEIIRFFRSYCYNNQSNWSRYLMWAEYAQNSLVKPSTGITPFQCILSFQPPMFPWSGEPSELPSVTDWLHRSEDTWNQAHTHLSHAVRRQARTANLHRRPGPRYAPGQWVWLSTRDLRLKLPCRKLSPRYVGPFQIIKQITPVSCRLDLPANYRISPTFHMSLLKPAGGPGEALEEEAGLQTSPILVDGEEAYQVHELLDSRRRGGTLQYLVDWEGFGPEERSWVNAGDILDPSLTDEFHRRFPEKPAPRP
ncbi:Transposon Tf2-9 polyprotein [Labeo rohita]|uniref:Gypsy retrotransposon integrase-like protein 1 n=1 Tax=Labeo rohita TaxID=84645 RepID=A0ABQ8L572_LABRO|nr:Transposon Tf2-9 polyprotein [Labeo rohita]